MNTQLMFSSVKDNWTTPPEVFSELDREFCFTLDAAASDDNHKCPKYYTRETDGLLQSWGGERVFVNPPYGREIPKWVKKSSREAEKPGTIVVMLIPARTDTAYFHDYIYGKAEIRFIRGRLKFGGSKNSAPFPSMIVIFK